MFFSGEGLNETAMGGVLTGHFYSLSGINEITGVEVDELAFKNEIEIV